MKIIGPNYVTLIFRVILFGFFSFFIGLMIYNYFIGKYADKPFIVYIGMAAFTMLPVYLGSTLIGVFGIEYSPSDKIIWLHRFPKGKIEINSSDITGYYKTTFSTRFKSYDGRILELSNGKKLKVTEFNLNDLSDFYSFLSENEIPLLGYRDS